MTLLTFVGLSNDNFDATSVPQWVG
ncbi:unnamed protein product [Amaranthus hypochondriacus]